MTTGRERGEGIVLALGLVALAAVNLLLWPVDYPPLVDWPNHLARHAIQCDPASPLARYYSYDFAWVPNLTAELVHLVPLACRSLLVTQKVLIQVATTGLLISAVVLHFAVWRRWAVWPLLAAFVTHHMAFAYGFENYVLAMPLVLIVLAAWFWLAERGPMMRLGVLAPMAGAVYICHVYAFAFLFGTVVLLEIAAWWRERSGASAVLALLAGLSLVAVGPVLHLAAITAGTAGVEPGATEFGGLFRRLTVGLSPFSALGQPYLDAGVLRVAALQLVALALVWGVARSRFGVTMRPGSGLVVLGMLIVAFLVPGRFAGVALTDIRFPVLVVCLVLALSDVRLPRGAAAILAMVIVGAVLSRTVWLEGRWSAHDAEVRELLAAGDALAPEDRMLVARSGGGWDVLLHSHSPSHLAREGGLFIPDLFSGGNALTAREDVALRDAFQPYPLDVRLLIEEAARPTPGPLVEMRWQDRYWARWTEFYSHVLVMGAPGRPLPEFEELGRIVARGSFFTIYEAQRAPG